MSRLCLIDADSNLEVWKDIKNYEGLYQISTKGRIKNSINNRILIIQTLNTSYKSIGITKDKKVKHLLLHRLLAETFIPNPLNLPQVNHKNGIKDNNSLDNLEWCTASNNVKHGYDNGLCMKTSPIIQYDMNGNFIKYWRTGTKAAEELNLYTSNLSRCCLGKRSYEGGFQWRYLSKDYKIKVESIRLANNRRKEVLQYDLNKNLIKEWSSLEDICKTLSLTKGSLSFHLNKGKDIGKEWKGFIWKFKNYKNEESSTDR